MKLLFCENCSDVFKLKLDEMRYCACGKVYGRYVTNSEAEVSANAISLAIGNGSLYASIQDMKEHLANSKGKAERHEYYQGGNGSIEYAWVRPNSGPGNPHTKVRGMVSERPQAGYNSQKAKRIQEDTLHEHRGNDLVTISPDDSTKPVEPVTPGQPDSWIDEILEAVRVGGWYDANPNQREANYMDTDVAKAAILRGIETMVLEKVRHLPPQCR